MVSKLCLFAHYDPADRLAAYVERYLRALRDCGFDIVFITTAKISAPDRARLAAICLDVIERENAGLDFGSWSEGLRRHGDRCEGELLLANDSVYGPIGDLRAGFERLRGLEVDVSGFVESLQHTSHLQSWFLLFSPRAQNSQEFRDFMAQDFAAMTKADIIRNGELGLQRALNAAGLSFAGLYRQPDRDTSRAIANFNPTHSLWRELIVSHDVPFLKVELLRDNPLQISDVGAWREVVTARAPDLTALIEAHRDGLGADWAGRSPRLRRRRPWSSEAFIRRDEALLRKGSTFARSLNASGYAALLAIAPFMHGLRRLAGQVRRRP